jgi:hypothetical protein
MSRENGMDASPKAATASRDVVIISIFTHPDRRRYLEYLGIT